MDNGSHTALTCDGCNDCGCCIRLGQIGPGHRKGNTEMINTMDELFAYLDEMTNRAKTAAGYNVVANVESICAQMWKRCTPHALTFWTTAGVLRTRR